MTQPASDSPCTALRGDVLSFRGDPFVDGLDASLQYERDALVVMRDGRIDAIGPAAELLPRLPADTPVEHYPHALITAGFVDTHVHYPQLPIIGARGLPLLDWLERYTFPAEQAYADIDHARAMARLYLGENLRNGITSAAVFCTVHPQSVDALFEIAQGLDMRLVAGKVLMDRHAPPALCDTAQSGYDDSAALIARWHGQGRLGYAITPRFAPSCSPAQLEAAGALWREHPDCFVQSHLSENRAEVDWVRELFPDARDYLDVYDRFGLLGPRAIYAHGIHLCEREYGRCHDSDTALAHCPTSNLFLGSGLFDLAAAKRAERPVRVGLGTDLGAGTSFSMLRTMDEAGKVAQLRDAPLSPAHALYLATRGGAHALHLDDRIGSIAPGMEADLAVLDLRATPLMAARMQHVDSLDEALAVLMTLGDDRAVRATWIAGILRHDRDHGEPVTRRVL
ncbi:guanine deaminase [Oleiagrimonas citrea]|uniref:Guanine deaminase n=1 Tax=Oleiagrimonas citrea TaxID=1665687 RepID=A0A846ZQ92_9GAMM|nr:guanine deaminase [Oleiagrimonas citrea]NKZ40102.1 guanine deaminase [Oleiagrimonas citrea]